MARRPATALPPATLPAPAGMAPLPATTADETAVPSPRPALCGLRKAVPDAEDGQHVARRVRLGLELATDVLHVRVDGSLIRLEGDAMDRVEELVSREDASRLASHRGKQLEFGGREFHPSARN